MRIALIVVLLAACAPTEIETCYGEVIILDQARRAAVIDSLKDFYAPKNVYVYPDSLSILVERLPGADCL